MSDGYRDDGTGTEDWGAMKITDQIAAWLPEEDCHSWYEYYDPRLRTCAEALREIVASGIEHETRKYAVMQVGLDELADARAVLAQLEKEGLT